MIIVYNFYNYSKFLYDLTRGDGSSPTESVVRRWIEAIADKIGVTFQYTARLHRILVVRANHLRLKVKSFKGSAKKQRFLQLEWKLCVSEDAIQLKVMENKIEALEDEVTELKCEVSHAAQDIQELRTVVDELRVGEEEQSVEIHQLKTEIKRLQSRARELTSDLCKSSPPTRGRSYKPESEYSESYRRKLKRDRTKSCTDSLSWLEIHGYIPTTVTVVNATTGEEEVFELHTDNLKQMFGETDEISEDAIDTVNMMLYIKDWHNVSDCAYHELAKVCTQMPRQYKLRERISALNRLWEITPTPNNTQGVQQSLKNRLEIRIRRLVQISDSTAPFLQNKTVQVKLSGDGTKIGKRLHVVAFTFTLLEEDQAGSAAGNHILAVFKQPESYSCLKLALADIIAEVKELEKIQVDDTTFRITYYMGGDWKFLAMVTGIDSASSDYACIWCHCKKDERGDIQREWSLSEKDKGARTIDENVELVKHPRSRKTFNVSNEPLFPNIPLANVVIDNLHLFLRTSDVLIDLLIVELRRQDAIEKVKKFSNSDLTRYKHIQLFQTFVSSLGIPGFEFYIGRSSKELKCRSLTGPEKLKLFRNISIRNLLPTFTPTNCRQIQNLWDELLNLNMTISKPAKDLSSRVIAEFERRARQWGEKFVALYQRKHVTPYIHALMNHVGEFMKLHGSIIPFTQQGLEKKNDVLTKSYFRSSSHQGEAALRQILEKQNRIEHLESIGVKRIKVFDISCSNCGNKECAINCEMIA